MSSPFLKWAGGKRWLASSMRLPIPESYNRYVEPFLGGGAIFFQLSPDRAILADINQELINLYQVMRDTPKELESLMTEHQARHSTRHYYKMRAKIPDGTIAQAARMLYLNRTCWNGLYRVNLRGEFNVPIGTKSTVTMKGESFADLSRSLKKAKIVCQDFSVTLKTVREGDFVFVDPPYTVKHNLNGFLKYNERIFSWSDQVRLRDAVVLAAERGAYIVVTNADHESVQELYADFEYRKLARASVLAADEGKRCSTSEAMFIIKL